MHKHTQDMPKGYLRVTCYPFNWLNEVVFRPVIFSSDVTPATAAAQA